MLLTTEQWNDNQVVMSCIVAFSEYIITVTGFCSLSDNEVRTTRLGKSWIVFLPQVEMLETLFKQGKGGKNHFKTLLARQCKNIIQLLRVKAQLLLDDKPTEL